MGILRMLGNLARRGSNPKPAPEEYSLLRSTDRGNRGILLSSAPGEPPPRFLTEQEIADRAEAYINGSTTATDPVRVSACIYLLPLRREHLKDALDTILQLHDIEIRTPGSTRAVKRDQGAAASCIYGLQVWRVPAPEVNINIIDVRLGHEMKLTARGIKHTYAIESRYAYETQQLDKDGTRSSHYKPLPTTRKRIMITGYESRREAQPRAA